VNSLHKCTCSPVSLTRRSWPNPPPSVNTNLLCMDCICPSVTWWTVDLKLVLNVCLWCSSWHGSGGFVVWDVGVGVALEETSVCANLRWKDGEWGLRATTSARTAGRQGPEKGMVRERRRPDCYMYVPDVADLLQLKGDEAYHLQHPWTIRREPKIYHLLDRTFLVWSTRIGQIVPIWILSYRVNPDTRVCVWGDRDTTYTYDRSHTQKHAHAHARSHTYSLSLSLSLSLSHTHTHICWHMLTYVDSIDSVVCCTRLSMLKSVYQLFHDYFMVHTHTYTHALSLCLSLALSLTTHKSARIFCESMVPYVDVFWRMLTYADVCWRMLTYTVFLDCLIVHVFFSFYIYVTSIWLMRCLIVLHTRTCKVFWTLWSSSTHIILVSCSVVVVTCSVV
jgi:hypothetical protein